MNRDNVVPFISSAAGALARRGAPDKLRIPGRSLEVECPRCAAVVSLEIATGPIDREILCVGCDTRFALVRDRASGD